jgi:hypothetical protein
MSNKTFCLYNGVTAYRRDQKGCHSVAGGIEPSSRQQVPLQLRASSFDYVSRPNQHRKSARFPEQD